MNIDNAIQENVSCEVWKYAATRALEYSLAEELIRKGIEHAYEKLPLYNPQKGELSTYVATITWRKLRDWVRDARNRERLLNAVQIFEMLLRGEQVKRSKLRLRVVNCVAMLSPLAQKVCDLHMDKLSLQKIAAAVNIPERTFFRKTWPSVRREFKLSWNMMGFNKYFTRTKKKGQNEMNMIQEMQLLGALVRDCHQSIDEMIAAGDVRVIRHLATSPDLGDHVDFLDFCEWCKRVKRFSYVKAYLVNGRVSEAAKAMSARLGHRVSTHSVLEVLSWLVKNFPW
jgi:RNA polymerase sigma factor (sigma-70 family)